MADRKSLPPEVIDALKRGNKIEAIKRLREAMALGLAEAKNVVEAHDLISGSSGKAKPQAHPTPKPKPFTYSRRPREDDLSPGEEPRNAASPLGIVVAIAAVVAAAWLYVKFG